MADLIIKYDLEVGYNELMLPLSGSALAYGMQDDKPKFWIAGNPSGVFVSTVLYVLRTGGRVPEGAIHIGTIINSEMALHIYMGRRKR